MRKNICLIVSRLSGGGVERVVVSLTRAFLKLNCKVDIIVFNNINKNPLSNNLNLNIHTIKYPIKGIRNAIKNPVKGILSAKSLRDKIIEIGVNSDLIISNEFWSDIICKGLNLSNIYYCFHSSISETTSIRLNNKEGFLSLKYLSLVILTKKIYKNQKIISVSKGVEQDLIDFGIQPKSVQTIYNPFDFKDIRQQSTEYPVEEQDYIIYVGHFSKGKRHDVLIHAYKRSNIKQKLLLLGDHNKENGSKIKQLVIDLNLQSQVIFKGSNVNPYPYIKNAKMLVLSSDFEGFGMVLVEALILHVPVVSTDCIAGPSEILINDLKPFLSPIGDIGILSKNIRDMVSNPVKITNEYTDKFSSEKSAKQYLSLTSNKD